MTMMNSINGFPVSMNFAPPPGVTPMDAAAFLTPQQKTAMQGGGGQAPVPGAPAQGGGGSSGLIDAIMKMFMSGGMGG